MPISKECAVELCKTLAAFVLCGGSMLAKALHPPVATVELALGATALIASLGQERAQKLDNIIGKMANQVVQDSDVWISARGPGARARREAALPVVQHIAPRIEPSGNELAKLGFNRDRIIEFYLERASELQDGGIFADRPENDIARELLGDVIGCTFDIVRDTPEMQSHALEELLGRSERIEKKIDDLPAKIVAGLSAEFLHDATRRGLEREAIIELARPLKSGETLDYDQSVRELKNAVTIALEVIERGERGSNLGEFIDSVLARVALETQRGRLDESVAECDRALDQLSDDYRNARMALIETAITQEILRRNPEAAARRIEVLVGMQTSTVPATWSTEFRRQCDFYYDEGRDKGINISLEIAIALARAMGRDASNDQQRGDAHNLIGNALWSLGAREGGTARLEDAVTAYREALKEYTRDKVPLDWAMTQNNLGAALCSLGERESGTARLEDAVTAFHEALKERTRDKVPLNWAMTQNNLGTALGSLGERKSGTARLEDAVTAFREALKERTRDKVPLDWATTQNNLGNALRSLGERESGTARLKDAVTAYREALKEYTRDKVPLDWAMTQNNLGTALRSLGARESGTARLEDAVTAYHEALKERTRDKVPLDWAMTQNNLGVALWSLGERESGTARLEDAVTAYREALKERTRDKVPLDWAMTQNNLGAALWSLGERESGTARLEDAVTAFREALKEYTRDNAPYYHEKTAQNLATAEALLAERKNGKD